MGGELIKLRIKAYSDEKFSREISEGEFRTLVNPENYTFKYKIEHNEDQAQGTSSSSPKFTKVPPENLELDFVFDRTGVITDYGAPGTDDDKTFKDEGGGVIDDLEQFKRVVFDYNGDQHRPNYLVISWGTLLFKGTLTEMDLKFKLFKPDGTPLRVTAHVKFKGLVEDNLRVARENNNSPDLTHVRFVKEGDTLPLMTKRIYGDSKYYLEVAKANNLLQFRKLKTGQQIFFPPIQKN